MMPRLIFFLLLLPSIAGAAYTLPSSIPHPTFGVNETVESVYGDANYYTHWIDSSHPGCVTTGNGTPAAPRCTLPTLTGLAPGSVVQLRGGPYSSTSVTRIDGLGTVEQPIFFRGESPTNKTQLSRNLRMRNSSYFIIENIAFVQPAAGAAQLDMRPDTAYPSEQISFVAVRNCEGTGTGTSSIGSAFGVGGSGVLPGHDVVYLSNKIHDYGYYDSSVEDDTHCISIGSNHYNTWYLNNEIYKCSGDGIGNGNDADHTTYNLYIAGNTIYNNRENSIDVKEVHNVIITENNLSQDLQGDLVIHYGPTTGQGPYNVWATNNIIHDSILGIAVSGAQDENYIIGNVIYGHSGKGIDNRTTSGGGSWYVYHNTLVDNVGGIQFGSTYNNLKIGGNIVAGSSAPTTGNLFIGSSTIRAAMTIDKELYYQGANDVLIEWGANYTSVAAWVSASGKGAGSLQADPLFINTATDNYRLQTGSPAINAGIDMSAINDIFQASFGTGVTLLKDAAGTTRPDGVWDIGAYEYAPLGRKYTGVKYEGP